MGTCILCGREMTKEHSCAEDIDLLINNTIYKKIKWGEEGKDLRQSEQNCPDCGAMLGGAHHAFCDVEVCPACMGQRLSCDCASKIIIRGKKND